MIVSSTVVALYLHYFQLPQAAPEVVRTPVAESALEITVQDASVFSSIARGSERVPMLNMLASASCAGDVSLQSIDLRRIGLGRREDIEGVYALLDGLRVSTVQSVTNRDGTFSLRFRDADIPACASVTLTVVADFADDADIAGEHRIILDGDAAVHADNATVSIHSKASTPVRRTTGQQIGDVTAELLDPLSRIRYGQNRTVARLRLTANGSFPQRVVAIRLENNGSASDGDLQNFFWVTNRGEVLSGAVPKMDGKVIRVPLNTDFLLEPGQTKLIELHADVLIGSTTTVKFVLEESSDVIVEQARSRRD